MKALFVVNARSGQKRRRDLHDVIRAACAWSHEIVASERKEDLDAIVDRAEHDGVDVIFAVGGDGTVHETAKRLIGRRPALGVVPTGSGNGFARHIGLPMQPHASIVSCARQRIVTIDTARVNGVPFLNAMGIGFDATIADAFARAGTRGLRTYVRVGLREFRRYRAEEYEIAIDGETVTRTAAIVAVANATQYGNNARIAPNASLQDGLLDVVVISDVSLLRAAMLIPALFRGTLHRSPHVLTRRVRHVEIRRRAEGPAHLDGEPVMMECALTIDVVPASLRVLVPDLAGRI